jgi:putative flippase GtrA
VALTPRAELLRFLRFALVGGAGFLIDAALLTALHHGANIDPFTARLISIAVAALATWRLNRALTFGASPLTEATEGLRYATVALLAAGLNYALYAAALLISPDLPPVVAAIGATFVTMIVSYAGYSRFVFAGAATTVLGSPSSQRR